MNNSSLPHSQNQLIDDPQPQRTHADRLVLALRYPADSDQPPITSVAKTIAGRVYRLAVYDADVLAGLLRMGWQEGGA